MNGSELGTVGLLVIFPVLAAISGSTAAALYRPSARLTAGMQYFAAGAVLAVIALDLLPGLDQQGNLGIAIAGFVLGAAVLLALRVIEAGAGEGHGSEAHGGHAQAAKLPVSLLVAVGVDLFVDGVLVGGSVATLGRAQGVALTIALSLVVLPLSVAVTVELANRGADTVKAALIPPLLALALAVGAIGGVLLLGSAPAALMAGIFAFGVAALLFLATEELLAEAHEAVDSPLLPALLFIGFFALYVLDAA